MLYNYERLLNSPANAGQLKKRALKTIEKGWSRGQYDPIVVTKNVEWDTTDSNRSLSYYKHSWAMLDEILSAFSLLPKELYLLITAINVAIDWTNTHINSLRTPVEKVSKFAWYDMAVGLRAQRLAYILDAGRYYNVLTPYQDAKLWDSLQAHQDFLNEDNNIVFHNNHGYYQAAGQIAMGRRFREISESFSKAYEQGVERLNYMLRQQFTSDGVHREHSPQYHYMVYSTLMKILQADLIEDNAVSEFAKEIEAALSWFILPDQTLANIGDSYSLDMYEEEAEALKNWQDEQMRYVVTNGEAGSLEDSYLKVFEEGGYFVVRKRTQASENGRDYAAYSYLIQTAAFHSRTHKHADDLSFIWYDKGQSILIDAGRYGYVGKTKMGSELWKQGYWYSDPHRIYCESTRAHNTLEFDGKNYPRVGVKPYGSAIRRSKVYENGLTVLETETKHFKSIRRVRVLIYLPGQWLITYDWFKDNLNDTHDVRQYFNFSPDVEVKRQDNAYSASLNDNSQLYITNLLDNVKASEVQVGVKDPVMQGWYSPEDGMFEPICSINYKLKNQANSAVATLFSFDSKPIINYDKNRVNLSGRRFNIEWRDRIKKYRLLLNRGNNSEDIQCLYEEELLSINLKKDIVGYSKI